MVEKLWIPVSTGAVCKTQTPSQRLSNSFAVTETERMSDCVLFLSLNQKSVMPSLSRLITDPSDYCASAGRTPLKRST